MRGFIKIGLLFCSSIFGLQSFSQAFKVSDYQKVLWMTTRMYGGQRSGAGPNWITMNHSTGTDFTGDKDGTYDLTGGWHDCGDHVMFGQTQFYSGYVLLKGYELWPAGYEDHYSWNYAGYNKAQNFNWEGTGHDPDGIPDILNEVKYATDFFIKCARSSTQFYSQKGQGNLDHKHWITSVKMATLATAEGGQPRVMYSNVKDASMASFCAATLALMSRMYRQYDAAYADDCLVHAKYAYDFAKANKATAGSPENAFYGANAKWQDDYAVMCTELYYATQDASYKTEALSYIGNIAVTSYCLGYNDNDDLAAYCLATLGDATAKQILANSVAFYLKTVDGNGLFNGNQNWGVLRYNANAAFAIAMNSVLTGVNTINPFIYKQIDYIMGSNTLSYSFIVGFGSKYPQKPHHRNIYLNDVEKSALSIPARNQQFGYLVGGTRDPAKFPDALDNYATSEGGIDYSAGLVGALAFINSKNANNPVTGVSISPSPASVALNSTATLTANIEPVAASNKKVTWKSLNTAIATIDANGIVTGLSEGTTSIQVTTADGGFTATVSLTVKRIAVTAIAVNPTTASMVIGGTKQLEAIFTPTNVSNTKVTWTTSDASIASVSATGLVTAMGNGIATITLKSDDGAFTATSEITVAANPSLINIKKATQTITIDGAFTETNWAFNNTMTKVASGTLNNTASFGLLWDDTYLYVGVKMIDAKIQNTNTANYQNDGVEVYFDMNHNGGIYDTPDRQLILVANSVTIWEQQTRTTGVLFKTVLTTDGYTAEIAIPWTNFGITPATAKLYGFDIAFNDADATTTRSNQTTWVGDGNDYLSTANFGDIQLLPAPSSITQTISLKAGWNLISTNINTTDSSIATIFKGLDLIEIKNNTAFWRKGQVAALNSLLSIEAGKAYLVNMNTDAQITITGKAMNPATSPITTKGWSLIGCSSQTQTAITNIYNANTAAAIKNFDGFWIPNAATNSIQNIDPGKGYFLLVK